MLPGQRQPVCPALSVARNRGTLWSGEYCAVLLPRFCVYMNPVGRGTVKSDVVGWIVDGGPSVCDKGRKWVKRLNPGLGTECIPQLMVGWLLPFRMCIQFWACFLGKLPRRVCNGEW